MIELMLYNRMQIEFLYGYLALNVYMCWLVMSEYNKKLGEVNKSEQFSDGISKDIVSLWTNSLATEQAGMLFAHTGSRSFDWIRSQVYSWWRCFD